MIVSDKKILINKIILLKQTAHVSTGQNSSNCREIDSKQHEKSCFNILEYFHISIS